ncbi:hypothetical protein ACOKM5_40865 [Streptomyces sp. BH097]|uniref:hypothetical protein n=1 Tax=unclassified Streptomyces TaxID=2593676 RepID=UPI003BB68944
MERDVLARLLAAHEAEPATAAAAMAALRGGATYVVWGGASSSEAYAHIYARRLRHTQRRGTRTLGLERAVQLLREHHGSVCLGHIVAADGAWAFMLFLSEDAESLVACTGVQRAVE